MKVLLCCFALFSASRLAAGGYGYSVLVVDAAHAPLCTSADFQSANSRIQDSLRRDDLKGRVEVFVISAAPGYKVLIGKLEPYATISAQETEYILSEVRRLLLEAKQQREAQTPEKPAAKSDRPSVEAVERPRQIPEAEADLARVKLQFEKQEAEFRHARKAKEKLLSDIAEQITAMKRGLDDAGNDSAEQYYGTMLLQLLGSFRGSEVFSGDRKIPRATDAAGVLRYVPKAQVATTANGFEDITNVRNQYYAGDLAFVNIPARENFTWGETAKIDKLIGEYLERADAYTARHKTLLGILQSEQALEVKTRAELESIAIAEAEARAALNRAQEVLESARNRANGRNP